MGGLSFLTPQAWLGQFGTRRSYEKLYFDRRAKQLDSEADIMGFGHPMFSKAISQGEQISGSYAFLNGIERDLVVFKVQDQITGTDASVKVSIVGLVLDDHGGCDLVKDEDLIGYLNEYLKVSSEADSTRTSEDLVSVIQTAKDFLMENVSSIGLPFKLPSCEPLTVFYRVMN